MEIGEDGGLSVTYVLTHLEGAPVECRFGSEWNLSPLLTGVDYRPTVVVNGEEYAWAEGSRTQQVASLQSVSIGSEAIDARLTATASPACTLWMIPIETASASEKGFERTYQGGCLYFHWPLRLEPAASMRLRLEWTAETSLNSKR